MCIFKGESSKYKYFLSDDELKIVSKSTGEVIEDSAEVLKIWDSLDKAVRKNFKPAKPQKHKFGTYGRVLLTENELNRLYDELGLKEANSCINYVDELAETNGNKYKWKNWNLVVRKCHREQWHKQAQHKASHGANNDLTTVSYDIEVFQEKAERLPEYKKADR